MLTSLSTEPKSTHCLYRYARSSITQIGGGEHLASKSAWLNTFRRPCIATWYEKDGPARQNGDVVIGFMITQLSLQLAKALEHDIG